MNALDKQKLKEYSILTAESEQAHQQLNSRKLFPHQLACVHKMQKMEKGPIIFDDIKIDTDIGILGAAIGSGKTTVMLSLISRCKDIPIETRKREVFAEKINEKSYVTKIETSKSEQHKVSLIIVPHSLIKQWIVESEFFDIRVFNASAIKSNDLSTTPIKDIVHKYDLFICSDTKSKFFLKNPDIVSINWERFILEETDSLRCLPRVFIKRKFTWLITASYKKLVNIFGGNLIHAIGHKIEFVYPYLITCSEDFVNLSTGKFSVDNKIILCYTDPYKYIIRGFLDPRTLEMLNAGNIEGVARALGSSVSSGDKFLESLMKDLEEKILSKNLEKTYISALPRVDAYYKTKKITSIDEQIKRMEERMKYLEINLKNLEEENCAICMEKFDVPTIINCNHIFCFKCISRWLKECPICRAPNTNQKMTLLTGNLKTFDKLPTKEEKFVDLIKELCKDKSKKILVFSQYESHVPLMKLLDISWAHMSGTQVSCEKYIQDFFSGKKQVLLLNSKHKGVGLNFHNTTDVILFHKLSEELEKQVLGRALRFPRNQNDTLTVHRLLYDKTEV